MVCKSHLRFTIDLNGLTKDFVRATGVEAQTLNAI